jgi:hypothetical protein
MTPLDPDHVHELAAELGLPSGRMITGSKSGYSRAHPDHLAVFNATIADEAGTDLWWGDLDLTLDEPKLAALAATLDLVLFVFYEGDVVGRELYGWALDPASAVARFTPIGEVLGLGPSEGTPERDQRGRLVRRRTAHGGRDVPT